MQHRLHGLRGKEYVKQYKLLFDELKESLSLRFQEICESNGKFTPINLGQLAIEFQLPVKVLDEFLADATLHSKHKYSHGTWERLQWRGAKAKDIGVEWK